MEHSFSSFLGVGLWVLITWTQELGRGSRKRAHWVGTRDDRRQSEAWILCEAQQPTRKNSSVEHYKFYQLNLQLNFLLLGGTIRREEYMEKKKKSHSFPRCKPV